MESLAAHLELQTIALDGGPLRSSFAQWGKTTVLSEFGALPAALEQRVRGARGLTLRLKGRTQWQLARWKPDIIIFNSCASLPLARYLPLPVAKRLLYVHETGRSLHHYHTTNQAAFEMNFDAYVAVSQHVARALQNEGVAPEKIEVIPNFLPDELMKKLETLRQNRPHKTAPPWVIGGAGTLSWTKGPETWLHMAAQLSRILGHSNVRFEWVGGRDTEADKQFAWMAHQLGLQSNFALVPATPDPFPHYATFDAFAFTSWEDSFGLVVLENMALGNVVACFAGGGGAPEIVGEAGIIITDFNPQEMAHQIAQVLRDPSKHAATSEEIVRRSQHFNAQRGAIEIGEIISSAQKGN